MYIRMLCDVKGNTIIFDAFIKNEKIYFISTYFEWNNTPFIRIREWGGVRRNWFVSI